MTQLIDLKLVKMGFSLQGVLDISAVNTLLPESAREYGQLLVFGHGGKKLWQSIDSHSDKANPIDDYSVACIMDFLARIDCDQYDILYPTNMFNVDLRLLGQRLGWHHDSPLGIGINKTYGTWFAYRVVVAANTNFEITKTHLSVSPCEDCADKPCITHCPVDAVGDEFNLQACVGERAREGSACAYQCLARRACPVGVAHRYDSEQIRYHYGRSLEAIRVRQIG